MKFSLIFSAFFLSLPVWAAAGPDPWAVLRESLDTPSVGYEALLTITPPGRQMSVRFSPPGFYRRELLGPSGQVEKLVVDDGRTEWIDDPASRKVWQGASVDPFFKRFGPDEEFDHLQENYEISLSSGEPVAGRACWTVELRAHGSGALTRRLWIDESKFLILKSETFRPDGSMKESAVLTRLRLGIKQDAAQFHFSPPSGSVVLQRAAPDYLALDEAKAAGLEPRAPAWLPSGYVFESLDVMAKGKSRIVHCRFSDGLSVVSLFEGSARMRLNFGGRRKKRVKLSAGRATLAETAEGNVLSWTSMGRRFILVGDVSAPTLEKMAESVK